jgi:hypothetical protein
MDSSGIAGQRAALSDYLGQAHKPLIISRSQVKHQNGSRRESHLRCHAHLMFDALGDYRIRRQVSIMIRQRMELRRPFGSTKLRSIKHRGAKIDHRGVQTPQRILKSDLPLFSISLLASSQGLTPREKFVKFRSAQVPRPMFIRAGESGASRSREQNQVMEFPLAGGQASANFAQRLRMSQLTKEHGNELTPTTETSGMPISDVLAHGRFKF